jgi:hypothetical protein
MKYTIIILLSIFLLGCETTKVYHWPEKPEIPQCEQLDLANTTQSLSDLLLVVANNYAKHKECKAINEAWESWYIEQKAIYDEISR